MKTLNYFDFYSKRLGIFYKEKEKISTSLGLILTFLHIIFILTLFTYYSYRISYGKELNVRESSEFQTEPPSVDIINSDLFYFAFGVEDPITTEKFIDETIYRVKVIYYDTKKENNGWFTIKKKYLNLERCDQKKFGEEYQSLIKEGSLNNSYCIDNINLTLAGSFNYKRMAYIKILIYPCINTTENNNHCKPQNIIDYYLSNGYFSILSKDVGLTPFNYNNPLVSTFQDLYMSIGKSFLKEYEVYYQIGEIKTDKGLIFDNIYSEKFLKFSNGDDKMNLRNEEEYYKGESICNIQIRLIDNIKVIKRTNMKIPEALALIGGYLRLLSSIFTIISAIPNDIITEKELINDLFHVNSFIEFKGKSKIKNKLNKKENKNKVNKTKSLFRSKLSNDVNTNNLLSNMASVSQKKFFMPDKSSKDNFYKLSKNYENNNNENNIQDNSWFNQLRMLDEIPNFKINEGIGNNRKNKNLKHDEENNNNNDINIVKKYEDQRENKNKFKIQFNLCQYFCCPRCSKNKFEITEFNKEVSFYHKQMDVINIFNCLTFIKENNLN